jgi:hypothetical protein
MQLDPQNMNLSDLYDLLVVKTNELLKLLPQRNADGYKIRDLKFEVENIQAAIQSKKSGK